MGMVFSNGLIMERDTRAIGLMVSNTVKENSLKTTKSNLEFGNMGN
jgi:hypothetical protein